MYWLAFSELTTERQIGMGLGPIPRSKVREYADQELGLSGDAHDRFCAVMRLIDDDYVSMANTSKTPEKTRRSEVPIDDVEGVTSLFDRLSGQQKRKAARNGHAKV